MELQIQDLVSSIRKEGLEAAKAEAESIIAEAKKKAESIVSGAKAEAQQHKDAAEKEIAILKESAEVGAEQAKRDAVLAFKTEIQELLPITFALQFGSDADGPHRQDGNVVPVITVDDGLHEHVLPYQAAVLLHDEVQLLHEGGVVTEDMHYIMLAASGTVDVPE